MWFSCPKSYPLCYPKWLLNAFLKLFNSGYWKISPWKHSISIIREEDKLHFWSWMAIPHLSPRISYAIYGENKKVTKGKKTHMIPKNSNEVSITDLPTVLIKLHKTGPFPERDRNTFIIDLQQTSCIFSVYCGKLLICSTTRCSRTGVYTSGT